MLNSTSSITNYQLPFARAKRGFSIFEIILATGLLVVIAGGAVGAVLQSFSAVRLGGEEAKATFLATEGLEAVRAIRSRDFGALTVGTYGLSNSTGQWEFSGSSDSFGKYTREIVISDVYRDADGNIVESGGVLDPLTKRVTAVVSWDSSPTRHNTVSLPTYFAYWEGPICNWTVAQQYSYDLDGSRDALDIKVAGDYAYVVTDDEELYILDVSTPSSPQRVGKDSLDVPWFTIPLNGVAVAGNYAYAASRDVFDWIAWTAEVWIFDVSDPSSPSHTLYNLPGASIAYDVAVSGNYLFVVTGENSSGPEFTVLDISNPASPARVGWLEIGSKVSAVYVSGDRAYIATDLNTMELMVIDISDKSNPSLLGAYDAPSASGDGTDVFVTGGTAYLVTENNDGPVPEFYILDVSNPSSISLIGSLDVSSSANGVVANDQYAFLATEKDSEEALVIDISDLGAPSVEAAIGLPDDANAVAIGACVAFYATDTDTGEVRILEP